MREPNAPPPRMDRDNIRAAIEGSLRRLKTSYVDLYQIHWPDRYVPAFGRRIFDKKQLRESISFEEQLRSMAELIKEGKIRHWGVSNETTFGDHPPNHPGTFSPTDSKSPAPYDLASREVN